MSTVDLTNWEILIVDDEPDNLTVLDTLLNFFDAHVTSANSGEDALNLLKTKTFKLCLFDIQMPKVSGWDLIKWVRENEKPEIRDICVIAVTALAMRGDEDRVLQAGFDGYVAKPIDANVFMEALQNILSRPKIIQLPVQHHIEPKAEPAPIVDSVGISEKMSQVISEARTHTERSGEIDLSNVADLLESNGHLLDIRYELETKDNYPDKTATSLTNNSTASTTNGTSPSPAEVQPNPLQNPGDSSTGESAIVNQNAPRSDVQSSSDEVAPIPAPAVAAVPETSISAIVPAPLSPSDTIQAIQEAK